MRGSRSSRRKINKRKSNKRLAILAFLVVATIFISIVTIPKFTSKAGENSSATNERILNILEIEPSEENGLYRLNSDTTIGSTKVNVTRMDMSRFISMIDEINGKYDVVYIGNNCGNLCRYWTASSRYRQYCNKTNLEWGDLWDRSCFPQSEYSQFLWYGNGGYVPNNDGDWNWIKTFNSAIKNPREHLEGSLDGVNYKPFVEYYSENDITNKRAKEIIKLLDSNQLVYMDSSISDLNGTKLQKLYREYNSKIQVVDNSDSLLNKIVSDYEGKNEKDKRPIVNFVSKPENDSTTLKFKFNFKGAEGVKYKAKLYIDKDGDGLYTSNKDSSVILKGNITNNEVNSLSYALGSKYVGYYGWKLEIFDTDNSDIKYYDTGYVIINNKNGNKKDINILQIKPNVGCTFDMANNSRFTQLLGNVRNYNVTVTSKTITDFNNDINNGTTFDDYSMIVLGFADSYGGGSNFQFSDEAINYLLDWNNKGKSLMLTHDTIGLGLLKSGRTSTNQGKIWDVERGAYCAYKLGRAFKDIAGQCRFVEDPFKNYAGVTYDDSYYEKFDDNRSDSENYGTLGITAYANIKLYEKTKATKVQLVNENQISNYPYKLSNEDKIDISETHCQWYQLNLEEDDVVPSYNLVDRDNGKFMDSGDSRNFCYTYTKGNITYTGSGHKEITQDSEMKLFINTMIKAYMAGNEPPEITNYNTENNEEIKNGDTITLDISTLEEGKGFDFYSVVKDDSSEDADMHVTIAENNNYLYNNVCKYNGSLDGIKIENLSISYNDIINNIGNTIKITSRAQDAEGASSEDAVFYLKVVCNKVKIINGINKDEEALMAGSSNIYSKYQKDWYMANSDEGHGVNGDTCYDGTNIALRGTRGYQYIVPFISKINTNVFNNGEIILSLDENYTQDKDHKYGTAYYDNNGNSICKKPALYLDYNNKLYKVKDLERDAQTGKYKVAISFNDLKKAYNNAGVDPSIGAECNLVLKYYGKTYNHNEAGESPLKYTNSVEFAILNGKSSTSTVDVYVGNKELSGNLF